jgi:hypothetical protein
MYHGAGVKRFQILRFSTLRISMKGSKAAGGCIIVYFVSDFRVKSSSEAGGQNIEDREGLNGVSFIYYRGHNGLLRFGRNLDRELQSTRFH